MIARTAMAAAAILVAALAAASEAQEGEPTLREVAQVLVNAAGTGNTTVSVTLQSTSTADIQLPGDLAARIGADDRLAYVVLTNEDSCVPGVVDESCVVVSSLRSGEWEGIDAVQAGAREIGDSYIDELNAALVSVTPVAGAPLMQVRVSAVLEGAEAGAVDPLALLPFDSLERSRVFGQGSSPLGSLVRAIVVPGEPSRVSSSATALLPTVIIDGQLLPSAVGHAGWVFDPVSGPVIEGRFLFGGLDEVEEGELAFTTVPLDGPVDPDPAPPAEPPAPAAQPGEPGGGVAWLPYAGLAAAAGAGAALYALWRRR